MENRKGCATIEEYFVSSVDNMFGFEMRVTTRTIEEVVVSLSFRQEYESGIIILIVNHFTRMERDIRWTDICIGTATPDAECLQRGKKQSRREWEK
jgi:hypothetical protein